MTDGDAALDAPFDGEPPPFFSAIVAGDRCGGAAELTAIKAATTRPPMWCAEART